MKEGSKAGSPLLHAGDPMLPGHGTSGLSPDVQWDAAAFSPEATTPAGDAHMDYSA